MTLSGWVFPPCIIVERGESLDEWALRIVPDFPTILTVLCHVLARLEQLHKAGLAHRDIKVCATYGVVLSFCMIALRPMRSIQSSSAGDGYRLDISTSH
jgi:hypothetical protein